MEGYFLWSRAREELRGEASGSASSGELASSASRMSAGAFREAVAVGVGNSESASRTQRRRRNRMNWRGLGGRRPEFSCAHCIGIPEYLESVDPNVDMLV